MAEPLGAVAIEAMSAGAAVVASNIGGLDTALVDNRNGVLVDPDDVTAWSAAVQSLLHSPERAHRLGAQAHSDVAGITVADHVYMLDQIISQAGRPRPVRTPDTEQPPGTGSQAIASRDRDRTQ